MNRFQSLDGWRGISILFVLAGHLLPLGPKSWQMNNSIATTGMVVFFILSGFLITNILLREQNIFRFLVRRVMRILPLTWLFITVVFVFLSVKENTYLSHYLFYANWPPMTLTSATSHLWSLCVEMQFYLVVAILVWSLKSKAFFVLPILCLSVTLYRYVNNVELAINTYFRVDEILAGCILALLYKNKKYSDIIVKLFKSINPVYVFLILLVAAHPNGGVLNYLRPYIAMTLIGSTLYSSDKSWWNHILDNKLLIYIASISFALYVIHGGLRVTWLGEGDTLEKYLKRPLLFALTFVLAHISTFYYEAFWIKLGKNITRK